MLDGQTGLLAKPDDVESFAAAIEAIEDVDFNPAGAVENAERYSVASFQQRLRGCMSATLEQARAGLDWLRPNPTAPPPVPAASRRTPRGAEEQP